MNGVTYLFKLGDFQCLSIHDRIATWTVDELIGGEKTQEQLAQIALEFELNLEKTLLPDIVLLVNTGAQNVLIDAGKW